MHRHLLGLVALLLLATGCTCGEKPKAPGETPPPPAAPESRKLEPLPEPPAIQVPQEALPGSDGTLAVVVGRPTGQVYGEVRPTLTFSKPVMSLGTVDNEKQQPPPATIEPAIPGEWRWLGSASVEFVPKGLVAYSTSFKVTVPAGLVALDGSKLEEPYAWDFQTPLPALNGMTPADGYRWITPDQTFTLTFNQPVKDLGQHLVMTANGQKVDCDIIKDVSIAEERRAAEKNRRFEREDFEERGYKNREHRYELKAKAPLPRDADVVLTVDANLQGEGPLTMGAERALHFHVYGPLKVVSVEACSYHYQGSRCSWGPIVVRTSNPVDPTSLKGKVTVTPDVAIDWDDVQVESSGYDNGLPYFALSAGKYRPGTTYAVKVAPGLVDTFKQTAAAGLDGTAKLDDLEPMFDVGSELAVLESGGDANLPITSANLDSVQVKMWPLTPEQVAPLYLNLSPSWTPSAAPLAFAQPLGTARNVVKYSPLPVKKGLAAGAESGFVLIHADAPSLSNEWRRHRRIVAQVTDLAVHTKLGATSGLVWVTSLSKGGPVAGARVRLLSGAGAQLWEGTTDTDGLARTPSVKDFAAPVDNWSGPRLVVFAEKDGQIAATASGWSDGLHPSAFDLTSDWDGKEPRTLGTLFTDRGIYRPGDEVFLKGLHRYRQFGDIKRAEGKVKVQVTSSRDQSIFEKEVTLSAFGTFDAKLQIPKDAPLGSYSVGALLPDGKSRLDASFRVEEYRAPQFRVDVTVPNTDVVSGDEVQATVLARYLFGGAMSKARVSWSVLQRSIIDFNPPNAQGFQFGQYTWSWDDQAPEPTVEVASGGEGETDEKGVYLAKLGKPLAQGNRPWSLTVEAEVTDVNRQRIANRTTFTVHPASIYAGLRLGQSGFGEVNKPVKVDAVAVDLAGKRLDGKPIAVTVALREWKTIKKKGVGGHWFTESELVETKVKDCALTSAASATTCELTPTTPGMYHAIATVTDDAGRKQTSKIGFYVTGPGWVSWQRNDTDRIDLVADKALYDLGDTAKVLIKNPYPKSEAVLTVEREGVLETRHLTLEGAAVTVDVPITENLLPNAFVGVMIFRGRVPNEKGLESGEDPGRPAARYGYVELKVEKKSKRLTVAVTPDAEEKRPGQKVKLDVKVTDWQGKGARSEVAVWAVDEGVLRLTDYHAPDPVEAIHPLRGLSVYIGEPLLHLVERRVYSEKGGTSGGSGGNDASGSGIRSNFKTTVLFAPAVLTDDAGHGTVEFTLPDNLTTFRIMAIATTPEDRFGLGDSKVVVSKPLLVLPALPRLARVGDKFEAGVVVHAKKPGSIAEARVRAEAVGLKIEGPAEKTVAMADGQPKEVRFNFVAENPSIATLRFKVEGGGESDGVEQKLPVQLPVSIEAVATYGDTTDKRVEGLVPPSGVRPGVGGLDVTMSSTILGGFDEGMRQLVEYPYGCLEQMSSRLVPLIALRELFGKFGQSWPGPGTEEEKRRAFVHGFVGDAAWEGLTDPDEIARRTIAKIEALQGYDGGYRYWPTAECSSNYASSYAVLALSRAKDAGYPVNAAALERGQRFLADTVAAGKCTNCGWGCYGGDRETRTFALYTLARTGAPKPSYYPELFQARDKLALFSRAMLADAMYVGKGDRAQAKQVMTELLNYAKESSGEVHFEETDPQTYATLWSSDTRTTAIVLQTLTDVAPDHPFVSKIGRYLVKSRLPNGQFRNTQESAFSLMALTEVVRTKEKDVPDFLAKVTLGDKQLVEQKFQGRSMDLKRVSVPIDQLGAMSGKLPFVFSKDGPGVLYYGALLRYAPAELPTTAMDRGIVVQRWFEPYQGGGQSKRFYAGDLVRVRVRVGTHMERNYVAVDVPLPAGLEPVDTSLATTAQLKRTNEEEGPGEGYEGESAEDYGEEEMESPWLYRFWSPFNYTEYRDDRVVMFADRLPPGVHVASFVARATTPGDFVLKGAQAGEMYAPETFGRSDGGRFEVVEPTPVAQK